MLFIGILIIFWLNMFLIPPKLTFIKSSAFKKISTFSISTFKKYDNLVLTVTLLLLN